MKKIFCLSLVLLMLIGIFAGCAPKVSLKILETEYALEDYAICVAKDNEALLNQINTALDELIKDGTAKKIVDKYISGVEHNLTFQQNTNGKQELIMATNAYFPPYEYYEGGNIVGIDAEMAAAIADKLDMKLVIKDTEFGSIIAGVQTGKYHMGMAGMTVTEDRLKEVNFSTSYATGVQVVIVAEGSEIKTVDDLLNPDKNYKVGVQQDTTGDIYLSSSYEDGGVGENNVIRYKSGNEAVQALLAGKVDAVVIDQEPAKAYVATNNK